LVAFIEDLVGASAALAVPAMATMTQVMMLSFMWTPWLHPEPVRQQALRRAGRG
jgi:hypothetical protein